MTRGDAADAGGALLPACLRLPAGGLGCSPKESWREMLGQLKIKIRGGRIWWGSARLANAGID